MLDSFVGTLRRGAERVQRRGEEVAHAARLRVEVFQLSRELDSLYGRLGRSYHAGAEVGVLQGVRDDIARVEDEIRARERLIEELGEAGREPEHVAPPPKENPTMSNPTDPKDTPFTTPNPTVQHSDERLPLERDTASQGNEPGRDDRRRDHTLQQADTLSGHDDPLDNK